jgi:(p)ppGpp synthase/HD superfamily hydrolase
MELPDGLDPTPVVRKAWRFAVDVHAGQRQDSDCAPFIEHPLAVGRLLTAAGFDGEVVAAGLLHDVVEDTDVALPRIAAEFGSRVCGLVGALTEDDGIDDYGGRKAAHRAQVARAGRDAAAIFAADKLAKTRKLRAALRSDPAGVAARSEQPLERKVGHYSASLTSLLQAYPDLPFLSALEVELRGLEVLSRVSAGRT